MVKKDAEWTGFWSSYPEGIVNMEDLHLSNVDMQITIWAKEGVIDGTIATKQICKTFPSWNFILLRGSVNGDIATVTAWDIIQGHEQEFAKLKLARDGIVMDITPLEGEISWFPSAARLGKSPIEQDEQPKPNSEFCASERTKFLKKMRENPADNS